MNQSEATKKKIDSIVQARAALGADDLATHARMRAQIASQERARVEAEPKVAEPSGEELALVAERDRILALDPRRFDIADLVHGNDGEVLMGKVARLDADIAAHRALRRLEAKRAREAQQRAAQSPKVNLPALFGSIEDKMVVRLIDQRLASLPIGDDRVLFPHAITFLSAEAAPAFEEALALAEAERYAGPQDQRRLAVILEGDARWDLRVVAEAAGASLENVGYFLEQVPDLRLFVRWAQSARDAQLEFLAARIEERAGWVAQLGGGADAAAAAMARARDFWKRALLETVERHEADEAAAVQS